MDLKCMLLSRALQSNETLKVPRPANAFMLYANENRKRMAQQYPLDSNKEISKRLGNSWKLLDSDQKNKYFIMAKQVDAEHKRKYPDYVYNPKEARLRKAMREANREHALGVSMQNSPRGRRNPPNWPMPQDEQQLMMTPSHTMRGVIASPMHCSSPGYPMGGPGNNQMPYHPMQNFSKNMHPMPPSGPMHGGNSFMQPNPLTQLQHQTDLWQHYSEPMRPTQPDVAPPYMMSSEMQAYPPQQEISPPDVNRSLEKPIKLHNNTQCFPNESIPDPTASLQHQQCNENQPPVDSKKLRPDDTFDNKGIIENVPTLMDARSMPHNNQYIPQFSENMMISNPFEKADELKSKKVFLNSPNPNWNNMDSASFNEHDVNYHREYVKKFLQNSDCEMMEIVIKNNNAVCSFNYVTHKFPWTNSYKYSGTIDINDIFLFENHGQNGQECDLASGGDSEILDLSSKSKNAEKTV